MVAKAEFIWTDGELVPWDDAQVHVLTHTLHYGLGVFEGVRRTALPAAQRFPAGEGEAFVGPLLAFGSALLSVLAIYYLYRAITRQD